MTTLIKIKRDSIKKNPNAGRDAVYIPMPWKTTFSTSLSKDELPDWLQKFVTEWGFEDGISETKGQFYGAIGKLIVYAQSVGNNGHKFVVEHKRGIQEVRSIAPESEYLYEYENAKIKCSNCKKMIPVKDIEVDWDDDGKTEICPECGLIDTFDYKYEDIKDVKK